MKSVAPLLIVAASVGVFALKSTRMPEYLDHECARQCEDGGAPKECRYKFVVETYQTLSKACYGCASGNFTDCLRPHCITADGNVRNVLSVNRMVPGPTIQVCEGDTVIVDVETFMAMSEGIGIHWHGILQKTAQHMDGVPMITQCPIGSGTFQYRFYVMDEGTHLWHAHAGVQRGDGMFGSFVVRQPPSLEPHYSLYDFDLPEHVMVLNEWTPELMDEINAINNMGIGQTSGVSSILINGRAAAVTGNLTLPRAVFKVQAGFRYRFRLISAGSLFCPLRVSIDDHSLLLIATDGKPFVPFEVGSVDLLSAERYDFVLSAVHDNGSFWLRVRGQGQCGGVEGRAVIKYVMRDDPDVTSGDQEEPEDGPAPESMGKNFNYWEITPRPVPTAPEELNVTDSQDQLLAMDALAEDDDALLNNPDRQFFLELNLNAVNNLHLFDPDLYPANSGPYPTAASPQINNITNKLGPVPLLSQRDEVPPGQICNSSALGDNCIGDWCECSHLLSVNVDEIVEMVITNPTRTNASTFIHPFHTHGFSFRVVAVDKLNEPMTPALFQELDEQGLIRRKLHLAPFKDTVALPEGGFVVIRFKADNPGVWFMHCHLLFHAELGMAVAMEVLDENGGLPPPPPGFPRCGPFALPDDESSANTGTGSSTVDSASGATTQGTYRSGAILRGSASEVQTATPSWVLPVILGLSAAVVGLASLSAVLWRRYQLNRPAIWESYPSYTSDRRSGCDPNDTVEAFSASSRRQERVGLTK